MEDESQETSERGSMSNQENKTVFRVSAVFVVFDRLGWVFGSSGFGFENFRFSLILNFGSDLGLAEGGDFFRMDGSVEIDDRFID